MKYFLKVLQREGLVYWRQPRLLSNAILFFIMIMVFFPLTFTVDGTLLHQIFPGLLWISVLLMILFTAEQLFQADYDHGIIEQWLISSPSLYSIVMAKVLVHWVFIVVPLFIICLFLALLFSLSFHEVVILMLSLLVGTPTILLLCSVSAAFSIGLDQKGALMALVLFPLTLPVLIFGSATLNAAFQQEVTVGYLALLLAFSLLAICFLPWAIIEIIRIVGSH